MPTVDYPMPPPKVTATVDAELLVLKVAVEAMESIRLDVEAVNRVMRYLIARYGDGEGS